MPTPKNANWVRRLTAMASLLAVLLLSAAAFAGGRIQWASTTVKENTDTKSWKIEVKIFMAGKPDVPHVPMKFEFLPTAYYERAMMDGDKLVERHVPLENRQELIEGVEVGFMDPGSGKIENRTQFSFKITRALGFDAGEYKVTVRDARNGQIIGTPVTLKLEGENEIIDRRAMVFADPKDKKKKKDDADKSDEKKDDADKSDEKKDEGSKEEEKSESKSEEAAEEKPGEIKKKPGGCGCNVAESSHDGIWAFALVGLGFGAARVRRNRERR